MIKFGILKTKNEPVIETKDLHIDCRQCGEPDLGRTECVRCICNSIMEFGEPERIILRSGVEREYSRDTVDLLRKITDSFCRTSVGRDGRRCSGCVLSSSSLEEEKWQELSFDNIDEILAGLNNAYIDCEQCQTCVSEAIRYFTILRDKLEELSTDAAMTAYRIVGA